MIDPVCITATLLNCHQYSIFVIRSARIQISRRAFPTRPVFWLGWCYAARRGNNLRHIKQERERKRRAYSDSVWLSVLCLSQRSKYVSWTTHISWVFLLKAPSLERLGTPPCYALIYSAVLFVAATACVSSSVSCSRLDFRQMKRVELSFANTSFNMQAYNKMSDGDNDTMSPAGKLSFCIRPSTVCSGSTSGHLRGRMLAVSGTWSVSVMHVSIWKNELRLGLNLTWFFLHLSDILT